MSTCHKYKYRNPFPQKCVSMAGNHTTFPKVPAKVVLKCYLRHFTDRCGLVWKHPKKQNGQKLHQRIELYHRPRGRDHSRFSPSLQVPQRNWASLTWISSFFILLLETGAGDTDDGIFVVNRDTCLMCGFILQSNPQPLLVQVLTHLSSTCEMYYACSHWRRKGNSQILPECLQIKQ